MRKGRLLTNLLCLSCALLSCLAAPAFAANITWKAASTGSWTVATNWLPNQVPGVNDVAIITAVGTYDVNINGNVSVNAINLGSSAHLRVNNATLTTTTGIAVGSSSTLEVNSGTLSGGGVSLNGQLSSTGTSNVNVALTTATASTIILAGTLTVANGFTNRGLLSYSAPGTPTLYVTSGTLVNASTGTISCATTGRLSGEIDNQGSVAVTTAQGFFDIYKSTGTAAHANSGSMSVSGGGQLTVDLTADTFTTSGNLSVDTASILRVSGGDFHQTGGTISGRGNFELITTNSATFVSNPTTAFLYLAGSGIVFPSSLVNGTLQKITLGFGADVTAPQLTNQAGYSLTVHEGMDALHVGTFFNLGSFLVPRSFLLDGNLNCGPLSQIAFGIGGTTPGTEFDQLVVTDAAQLGGSVFFNLENGFAPSPGDYFDVLTSPARIGVFEIPNGWDLGNDLYLATDPAVTTSESHPYRIRAVRQKWIPLGAGGTPPPPRREHSAVYAPASDRMIVFGGENGAGTVIGDAWVLTHASDVSGTPSWIQLSPLGVPPAPRKGHSAVYDGLENRMIVFGGENDSSTFFGDTWILTNADGTSGTPEWIKLPQIPGPVGRSGHAAGYDPINRLMVVSGGEVFCNPAYGDMWVLDHANGIGNAVWSGWSTSGTPPSGRRDAAVGFDPQGNRLFVIGGRVPCSTVLADAFVLQNASGAPGAGPFWGPLGAGASPVLPGRAAAKGAYDPWRDRFLSFGGLEADGTTPSGAVSLITDTRGSNAGWTELPVPATAIRPSARAFHSLVYDGSAHRAIVFGGDSSGVVYNDVWLLELEGDAPSVTGIDPTTNKPANTRGLLRFSAPPSPNPTSHDLEFAVHASQDVAAEVRVYDARGRRMTTLFEGPMAQGEHRLAWKANVASGIYFIAVRNGEMHDVRRVVVAR